MLALAEDKIALYYGGSHITEPFPAYKDSPVLLGCYQREKADYVDRIRPFPTGRHSMKSVGQAIQLRATALDPHLNTECRKP